MTISNSLNTIKAAMATVSGQLAGLKSELSDVERQLGELRQAKAALYAAPISLDDYSEYLKKGIQQRGKGAANSWARDRHQWPESYGPSWAEKSWSAFEEPAAGLDRMLSDFGNVDFAMLCFLMPDVVHSKLMERLHEVVGATKWGNTEHPTVASRKAAVAELDSKMGELEQRRSALNGEIQEITTALGR